MDLNEKLLESNNNKVSDSFILKLYHYYIHKGYFNLISTQIVSILTTIFLFLFIIFLFNCVDYHGLFILEEKDNASNYINWDDFFNYDILGWICFILFGVFIICKILSLIEDIKIYYPIKLFYNDKLFINDSQIISSKWISILEKTKEIKDDKTLDIYTVTSKIMAKDNYLISLIDKDKIKLYYMTKLMEWNIKYCIIHHIFNDKNKLKNDLFDDREVYIKEIRTKLKIVSIVNFIFMPVIFIFVAFHNFFKYGEFFYTKPELVTSRQWTLLSNWKYRNYNELYHLFKERMDKSIQPTSEYINQFPSKVLETFAKLVVFVLSSLFLLMLVLTLINENLLINLHITNNRPILWYIGILGTIIAISKSAINDKLNFYPKEKFIKLREIMKYIPESWVEQSDKLYIKNKILNLFKYQIFMLLSDILHTLTIPFSLWYISHDIDEIVDFIIDNTNYDSKLGYTCDLASFKHFERINYHKCDTKTYISFDDFNEHYPNWLENKVNSNSVSINVINVL